MLEALTNAVDVAWERRYNDSTYWSFVVEAVNDLVSEEEMKKFKALCFSGEFGLGDYDDDEVNDLMNRLKGGSNEDDEEDSDNMPAELFEDSREFQDARDGYLAREMWKGYREWIRNRPGEQERFREFMVSSVCCFIIQSRCFYQRSSCASYDMPTLLPINKGRKCIAMQ